MNHDLLITVGILLLVGLVVTGLILFGPDPEPVEAEHWLDDYRGDRPTSVFRAVDTQVLVGEIVGVDDRRPAPVLSAKPIEAEVDPLTAPIQHLDRPMEPARHFEATVYALAWDLSAVEPRPELVGAS